MASLDRPAAVRARRSPFRSPTLSSMPPFIRLATERDLEAINAIYNHYVPISTTTYDDEPMSLEERRTSYASRQSIHPLTVACVGSGETETVIGYGSLHPFRSKRGYRFVVENSVYVHPDYHQQGIGSAILADLIDRGRAAGLHAIVAGIDSGQAASIALHAKHGFTEVARFPQIGWKFDRWLDVVFMQLILA